LDETCFVADDLSPRWGFLLSLTDLGLAPPSNFISPLRGSVKRFFRGFLATIAKTLGSTRRNEGRQSLSDADQQTLISSFDNP